jgi:hypothetical protein
MECLLSIYNCIWSGSPFHLPGGKLQLYPSYNPVGIIPSQLVIGLSG